MKLINQILKFLRKLFLGENKFNPNFNPLNTPQEKILINLINDFRVFHGYNPVKPEVFTQSLAYSRAINRKLEILQNKGLSHSGFDKILQLGLNEGLEAMGENLGYGSLKPINIFNKFINSKSHKDNILHASWKYIGISTIPISNNLVVVLFAR